MKSLMHDFGNHPVVTARTYSTAATGMVGRRGLGETRHVRVCDVWLHVLALRKEVAVTKGPGDTNPPNLMAEYMSGHRTANLKDDMGLSEEGGNHELTRSVR